jgi:SLT domain-containing protein
MHNNLAPNEGQDKILKVIALQSSIYNNKFKVESNFEEFNKFCHGKLYPNNTIKNELKSKQAFEKRLNIKNYVSDADM